MSQAASPFDPESAPSFQTRVRGNRSEFNERRFGFLRLLYVGVFIALVTTFTMLVIGWSVDCISGRLTIIHMWMIQWICLFFFMYTFFLRPNSIRWGSSWQLSLLIFLAAIGLVLTPIAAIFYRMHASPPSPKLVVRTAVIMSFFAGAIFHLLFRRQIKGPAEIAGFWLGVVGTPFTIVEVFT